jgi:Sodium/hydrogen exchanger family
MDNIWFQSALWMALALLAAICSLYITISAALFEIVVGAFAGNTVGLPLTPWINYIASFGAIVLTFLAGTDIDPHVVKRNFASSVTIGVMGFFAPYIGCLLLARYGLGWPWPQAQIGGIALSTTSVAVVYAVMVETGYNRTELGKIILAACFINDIGTVLARPRFCQLQYLSAHLRRRHGCCRRGAAVGRAMGVRPDRRTSERARDQVPIPRAVRSRRSRQSRQKRSGATGLPGRDGAGAILHGTKGASAPAPCYLLRVPDAVLFSQGWLADRS